MISYVCFQLPLSGSLITASEAHAAIARECLSTPSLGITEIRYEMPEHQPFDRLSTPSLGITTLATENARSASPSISFNSLSRDHLGITRHKTKDQHNIRYPFNSLSRDHRALFRDFPALRGFPPRRPFAHLYFSATI